MRLITLDDFIDTYFKIKQRGKQFFFSKFTLNREKRTKSAFNDSSFISSNFWSIPMVNERWNFLISGNKNKNYLDFLKDNFDHTLLVASDDPEKDQLQQLDGNVAKVIILPKISCEMFAEMTFQFIKTYFSNNDIDVHIEYVKVAEHEGNSATYCD